jgi:hypothetical protein
MRACFPVPDHSGEGYFFRGAKYAKIKFVPSSPDEQIVYGPASVAHEWKTLAKAGFSTIDAALPVPGHDGEVYFFSGTKYVRIKFVPGTPEEHIVFGPANIADEWKALAKAGFATVDAVLPVPGHDCQAYFFSGNQYAKIKFTPGTPNEEVLYGPTSIVGQWKTLNQAGFDTIDAVFAVPGHEGQAYFFSGSQYVKIKFVPSSGTEEILYGPTRITKEWKTLAWGW